VHFPITFKYSKGIGQVPFLCTNKQSFYWSVGKPCRWKIDVTVLKVCCVKVTANISTNSCFNLWAAGWFWKLHFGMAIVNFHDRFINCSNLIFFIIILELLCDQLPLTVQNHKLLTSLLVCRFSAVF
jgi:hypothetical protein